MLTGDKVCKLLVQYQEELENVTKLINELNAQISEDSSNEKAKSLYTDAIITQVQLIGYIKALHDVLQIPSPGEVSSSPEENE